MTTPLKHVAYIETVLKDISHVLRVLHEDQRVPIEQRSRLSGCLDELAHAQLDLQDDETGLKVLLEQLYAFYEPLEPPVTRSWTRVRGSLVACVEKTADTYYYTTQEDQGGHDWRVLVSPLEFLRLERHVFTPQQLLERVKQHPEASRAAILDYDTSRLTGVMDSRIRTSGFMPNSTFWGTMNLSLWCIASTLRSKRKSSTLKRARLKQCKMTPCLRL
jgi:hypothetical protein